MTDPNKGTSVAIAHFDSKQCGDGLLLDLIPSTSDLVLPKVAFRSKGVNAFLKGL